MKLINAKIGEIMIKDILLDIGSQCKYQGNYEKERNNMVKRINFYLRKLSEKPRK